MRKNRIDMSRIHKTQSMISIIKQTYVVPYKKANSFLPGTFLDNL